MTILLSVHLFPTLYKKYLLSLSIYLSISVYTLHALYLFHVPCVRYNSRRCALLVGRLFRGSWKRKFLLQVHTRRILVGRGHHDHRWIRWHDVRIRGPHPPLLIYLYIYIYIYTYNHTFQHTDDTHSEYSHAANMFFPFGIFYSPLHKRYMLRFNTLFSHTY